MHFARAAAIVGCKAKMGVDVPESADSSTEWPFSCLIHFIRLPNVGDVRSLDSAGVRKCAREERKWRAVTTNQAASRTTRHCCRGGKSAHCTCTFPPSPAQICRTIDNIDPEGERLVLWQERRRERGGGLLE